MCRKAILWLLIVLLVVKSIFARKASTEIQNAAQNVIVINDNLPFCLRLEYMDYSLLLSPPLQQDCLLSPKASDFIASMIAFLETVLKDLKTGVDADDTDYREAIGEHTQGYSAETAELFFGNSSLIEKYIMLDLEGLSMLIFKGFKYSENRPRRIEIIEEAGDMLAQLKKNLMAQEVDCDFFEFQKELSPKIAWAASCND